MFFLLLQHSDSYEAGYRFGQVLGPCCCLAFVGMIGAGVIGGVVYFVRRSSASSPSQVQLSPYQPAPSQPAPNQPPPSHYQWSDGAQPNFQGMQAQQQQLFGRLAPNQLPESDAINAAAKKLVAQDFDGAIAAYDDVAQRFPHRAADAHGQIGAAWFFKRDYDRALWHYRRAIELGAERGAMDDNIREAEEAKRRQ